MKTLRNYFAGSTILFLCLLLIAGCSRDHGGGPAKNTPTAADLSEISEDIFKDMDGGLPLSPDEIKGRNTWLLWTSDNAAFWDWMARYGFGTLDLLKILDSRGRPSRFKDMGLMNDPDCKAATQPDTYGLWLDERLTPESTEIDPKVYGRSSGIVGLRLFPNPAFDEQAKKNWDAQRYYNDPGYYNNPNLVRPYLVGMSCGFCHVAPNPLRPPVNPENPRWENLSSNIGNQYFNVNRIFGPGMKPASFVYQLTQTTPRGTVDTSFVATDHINNPTTINAIFNVGARLSVASEEKLAGTSLKIPGTQAQMMVPHILKDGADSVGILGALSRVYVNEGEFSEEWLKLFQPVVGGKQQRPFRVSEAQKRSVYWQASAQRVQHLAAFFLKITTPMYLKEAPGGKSYLTTDQALLTRGKIVYADNCAECHSSKQPPANIARHTPAYTQWMRTEVLKPDFLDNNYLADDRRYPVTQIKTNAARALADNATRGHVWDNFSSETYKSLPSVGTITVYNPFDGTTYPFQMPAGGPGYYRTPSLVSLWTSAPFLHNNALGIYTGDPSVAGRMKAFDDAVEKLLWPQKRLGKASIWRTTQESYLEIPGPYLPAFLNRKPLVENGYLRIGPIPAGTPVNLLANIDVDLSDPIKIARLVTMAIRIKNDLLLIRLKKLDAKASTALLAKLAPGLLKLSKCPDFIEDRGHYFGTQLPDQDKKALIEYLKTL